MAKGEVTIDGKSYTFDVTTGILQGNAPVQNGQTAGYGAAPAQRDPYANRESVQQSSSIRVEDADIPPFLRRKFHK